MIMISVRFRCRVESSQVDVRQLVEFSRTVRAGALALRQRVCDDDGKDESAAHLRRRSVYAGR